MAGLACVIIGAGFAGASTAWALARAGAVHGVIVEREFGPGTHASGRNAGLVRLVEDDSVVRALAVRSLPGLRGVTSDGVPAMRRTGALSLAPHADAAGVDERCRQLQASGLEAAVLEATDVKKRFPSTAAFDFDIALFCPDEGVVDIHALLTWYVDQARRCGFALRTRTGVDGLIVEHGRVAGVRAGGAVIRADAVVDATGAWAGRLGRATPMPLQAFRRHLCTTGRAAGWDRDTPYVWMWSNELYCRSELDGLLMSPCDVTPDSPETLADDPAIGDLLAARLAHHAPGLLDLPLRRSWACLRTFAPDHRPCIGPDPDLPGLFHVSGLGGFGMMTSPAVGEAAAALILGRPVDWLNLEDVSPLRLF